MQRLTCLAVAIFVVTVQGADDKTPSLKGNIDHLDKAWQLKWKSVTSKEAKEDKQGMVEITTTLEFIQDVPDVQREAIKRAFIPIGNLALAKKTTKDILLWVHLFDEDNVLVRRLPVDRVAGEISGKAGDAFRPIVFCPQDAFKNVRKVELRPTPSPEKK